MSLRKSLAFFRCEASPSIGAGHAMRCSVLGDALSEKGWACQFITSQETYDFIPDFSRFERIDPNAFYENPVTCDLLVIDHYDLDVSYENHFRSHAQKIMVIDDLANRPHDCDILLDQTYGRNAGDYRPLVPEACEILAGSEYALLRPEFAILRPKALERRKNTTEIKKILISMGGSDPKNFTLEALKLIKESEFTGDIDVVLGFFAPHMSRVKAFADTMLNHVVLHTNADMPQLIYKADLAIGAAGSSVWERCCLGLPAIVFQNNGNQSFILSKINQFNIIIHYDSSVNQFLESYQYISSKYKDFSENIAKIVDGSGLIKIRQFL